MPDTACGFHDMPIFDMPAPPASVRHAAHRRRLRSRLSTLVNRADNEDPRCVEPIAPN